MAVTDPVDARLLAALADQGKAAVHELGAKLGMDPREVAYRLVALSGSGLPLLVGVECDPKGLRAALAGAWQGPPGAASHGPPPGVHPGGPPSGAYQVQGTPSGTYQVQGTPSGVYPAPGGYPVQGTPSGVYPTHGGSSGAHPVHGTPSGTYHPQGPAPAPGYAQHGPGAATAAPAQPVRSDPVMSTWGPPQSASWARGDQPPSSAPPASAAKGTGRIGDVLATEGLEGEQLTVQLLEVQDPADYLFGAAGYSLQQGERSVVVHTEITNTGQIPFISLPDNYLELLADDGAPISKAPVSLTSRPPHRIGVRPGETLGGHTVYVLPESTRVVSVRWNRRPESDECSLTWGIED